MEQQLEMNLLVPIPDDLILIKKMKYEELEKQGLLGRWWSMKDLEERTGRQATWLKENILLVPFYKNLLDIESEQGGCVFYPTPGTGEKWTFQAKAMANFLDTYFPSIFTKKHR